MFQIYDRKRILLEFISWGVFFALAAKLPLKAARP